MAAKAKWGYRVDGTRKKKPGPKKGKRRSSGTKKTKKRKAPKRKRKPRVGSCLYGRTAAGKCRKTAFKSRGGNKNYKGFAYYERTGLGKAIYDVKAGPARM